MFVDACIDVCVYSILPLSIRENVKTLTRDHQTRLNSPISPVHFRTISREGDSQNARKVVEKCQNRKHRLCLGLSFECHIYKWKCTVNRANKMISGIPFFAKTECENQRFASIEDSVCI